MFLVQKVRVLMLSEVLAPFDLNKGLRQGDTWFPTAGLLQLHTVVRENQCDSCGVFKDRPAATFLIC